MDPLAWFSCPMDPHRYPKGGRASTRTLLLISIITWCPGTNRFLAPVRACLPGAVRRNAGSYLSDLGLAPSLVVVRYERGDSSDQLRFVAGDFEVDLWADSFVETFDERLELRDEERGNDSPGDGLARGRRQRQKEESSARLVECQSKQAKQAGTTRLPSP